MYFLMITSHTYEVGSIMISAILQVRKFRHRESPGHVTASGKVGPECQQTKSKAYSANAYATLISHSPHISKQEILCLHFTDYKPEGKRG